MSVETVIARTARVYLPKAPTASELAALVNRVNSGVVSLNQQILELSNTVDRDRAITDSLVKMFFILLDRAPDYATYQEAITLLEKGTSLSQLATIGLSLKAGPLSSTLNLSNTEFVDRLANQVFQDPSTVWGLDELKSELLGQLDSGHLSRSQLIDLAVNYSSPTTRYESNIEPALYYLAAGAREASDAELAAAQGTNPLVLLRTILNESGESPTASLPYFQRSSTNLVIDGGFSGSLLLDMTLNTINLNGKSTPRVISSIDGGASEQSSTFSSSLLSGVRALDATLLGTSLSSMSIAAGTLGLTAYASDSPTTLKGGLGSDHLVGGTASDSLYASPGNDRLTGGLGGDIFYLPPSNVFLNQSSLTTITDFGRGADALDFSLTLGRQSTTGPLTPIVGTADRDNGFIDLTGLENGSVVVVANTGVWVDEVPSGNASSDLARRTPSQIASLFTIESVSNGQTTVSPVVFTTPPTRSSSYIILTVNDAYGAEIWLVSNFSLLDQISDSEVTLIGLIEPSGDLFTALTTAGALLG